jgi:nicotinate phosphoribosyltransferase
MMSGDTVTVAYAPCAGQPLLQLVMQGGKTLAKQPTLIEARAQARRQLNGLPAALRQLRNTPEYPVIISAELQALAKKVDEQNVG